MTMVKQVPILYTITIIISRGLGVDTYLLRGGLLEQKSPNMVAIVD